MWKGGVHLATWGLLQWKGLRLPGLPPPAPTPQSRQTASSCSSRASLRSLSDVNDNDAVGPSSPLPLERIGAVPQRLIPAIEPAGLRRPRGSDRSCDPMPSLFLPSL
ncbi:hypothetical protein AGOR_G00000930 [Albula goreensis]|uniref:Uncharacterized protein n=1 Tax=Albula goreensis TaxID=1534307 RepID=A0A8T3EA27_9TELE|nr:hypothetical protein AGOR_G00000930 [Albula goreensis]